MRRLMLKSCQLDQAGEVSYQALNAITSAMLTVKGEMCSSCLGSELWCSLVLGY